ncbi:hypothetical protein LSAT2_015647 [Lamellibrachia satsuma]|nr:hypothetical protein LSAT2_015647 [Lamellibrachia satsuma]
MLAFALNSTALLDSLQLTEACVSEMRNWLTSNYFKLNDQKSMFLLIVPAAAKKLVDGLATTVCGAFTPEVDEVEDLGAHLDRRMNMSANTSVVVGSCYFHLHHIS